jgi:hypothetical protein
MRVPKGYHDFANRQIALLREHVNEQSHRGNIEGQTQKDVAGPDVELS